MFLKMYALFSTNLYMNKKLSEQMLCQAYLQLFLRLHLVLSIFSSYAYLIFCHPQVISGKEIVICRSKRPGLSSAGSRTSGRLVVQIYGAELKKSQYLTVVRIGSFDLMMCHVEMYEKRIESPLRSGPGVGETGLEWQREWGRQQLSLIRDKLEQHCRQVQQPRKTHQVVLEDQVPDIG